MGDLFLQLPCNGAVITAQNSNYLTISTITWRYSVENYYDEFLEEIQEANTMADADYLLGKVADLDQQISDINGSAQTQLERIGLWQETRTVSIEKQKDYVQFRTHAN